MLFLAIVVVVAVWAVWVAYTVNREGGYPPYQDSTEDMKTNIEPDQHWPFPTKDKP